MKTKEQIQAQIAQCRNNATINAPKWVLNEK